jgi:hypothetical protein
MTISLDQINAIINVEITDLTFVSAGVYTFDTDVFRQTLRNLEDEEENCIYPKTHDHVQPITVGGVALARVIEISPHWGITFENGLYRVTLEGSNNNILDVATVNQVSIASTNSAGLTYSKQVEDAAFSDARVWIDGTDGVDSVLYPAGTPARTVNNLTNAQTIITVRGLAKRLHLRNTITFGATDNVDGYNILGEDAAVSEVILTSGCSTSGVVFDGVEVLGTAGGEMTIKNGEVNGITNFEGHARGSELMGTITLSAVEANTHEFVGCYSGVVGTGTPILDCNDLAAVDVQFRGYHGGLEIRNFSTVGSVASFDLDSAHLVLASTCTDGVIVVRGSGHITDNSGAGCTVIRTGFTEGFHSQEVWTRLGLEAGNAITDTTSGIDSQDGSIDINRTGDGVTSSTLTRQ